MWRLGEKNVPERGNSKYKVPKSGMNVVHVKARTSVIVSYCYDNAA